MATNQSAVAIKKMEAHQPRQISLDLTCLVMKLSRALAFWAQYKVNIALFKSVIYI